MATLQTLPALLDTLSQSLNSALEATPKIAGIESTTDGVSLLNVKNELLLSYLQNLVFLILIKIRNSKAHTSPDSPDDKLAGDDDDLPDAVTKKLVELRLYLEKGVRPLEEKLRYQLDKILRTADDAERNAQIAATHAKANRDSDASEDEDDDDDAAASDSGVEDPDDPPRFAKSKAAPALGVDPSAKRSAPKLSNFSQPAEAVGMAAAAAPSADKAGVYRPPRIAPTAMPTTERRRDRQAERSGGGKSATMDEYVSQELSSAPQAMPSVGTTIVSGGRRMKSATEREDEDRRRDYEESNFVRLPQESKKDRAERKQRDARSGKGSGKMSFGGEEWRELGGSVDRISRLTGRGSGGGGSTKALLEKSRKRGRDTTDSARGSGLNSGTREIGDRFNKRVKVMEGGRRDRGK